MAQITLAVKYRPTTFDDVVEQEAIKAILTEQLQTASFKHAYLFCGPAGCGKTTAARIFANEINEGKGNPIEVDAASNNGVDNIREIIDNAKRRPLDSDYKVYIIDEVHMLSTGAWNAMLKLLEEPPKTTIFIMCTTDPQKIPATILSRVQRYDFSKISLENITDRLRYIINQENLDSPSYEEDVEVARYVVEDDAIEYIAKLAEGGMRDAITMLDKCLSLNKILTVDVVVRALGTVDYDVHFNLLLSLAVREMQPALQIIDSVYNAGKDIKQFVKQFQYFIIDVCKYKLFQNFRYVRIPDIEDYKQKMEDEDYEECLNILEWSRQLNSDIKWESNAKAMIECAIILYIKKAMEEQ